MGTFLPAEMTCKQIFKIEEKNSSKLKKSKN